MTASEGFWTRISKLFIRNVELTEKDLNEEPLNRHPQAVPKISDHAFAVATSIRNDLATRNAGNLTEAENELIRPPAIVLHGIMPRSGTVHIGNLIQLHPDISEYPNEIWELPFLCSTDHLVQFQKSFFDRYSMNDGKLGPDDFMPIFGSAILRYLHEYIPADKRLFFKEPRVEYLDYFFAQFPSEMLVLLTRDGRDVVNSTVRSWPEYSFEKACLDWSSAARQVSRFMKSCQRQSQVMCVKFENVIDQPKNFIDELCDMTGLDRSQYPMDKIDRLPVQGSSAIQTDGKVDWEPKARPEGFNPVGRWSEWDSSQVQTFKRIAGEALVELNYENDLNW